MSSAQSVFTSNLLLAALPHHEQVQLVGLCELIHLNFAEILYSQGDQTAHIYFPIESFISLVMPLENDASLEVGLIGNEGMLGVTLLLGLDTAPFQTLVQGAGSCLRISSQAFLQVVEQCPYLQGLLKRYLYVTLRQLGQTAACCRIHVVEERLARWLLMTQDRARANTFHITHLFLAYMLGVRRVGITKAASSLQRQKLISYRRGNIIILNRSGLEEAACSCYQTDKHIYHTVMI